MLCQIVDNQLLAQIERYLKQAVVDKSPVVAASVLVSALHLMHNVGCLRGCQGAGQGVRVHRMCVVAGCVFACVCLFRMCVGRRRRRAAGGVVAGGRGGERVVERLHAADRDGTDS